MARDADMTILRKRGMLATVRGVVAHSVGGAEVETAPCDMLLGNATLHVSRLDVSVCTTAAASVVAERITLNCEDWPISLLGPRNLNRRSHDNRPRSHDIFSSMTVFGSFMVETWGIEPASADVFRPPFFTFEFS
ncbi:hypothetical protein [Rhizobium leguminosarum]|uniref:hypothetical protein n=1 Tax=Rhizobium leguminosarum TaxID=384 RepID=UPI001FED3655|nr:hypothetical protein [Rhizobium leguminosarum]